MTYGSIFEVKNRLIISWRSIITPGSGFEVVKFQRVSSGDSIQLALFLLKEKATKTASTYSPVSRALGRKEVTGD
jgi:hypothetical protein